MAKKRNQCAFCKTSISPNAEKEVFGFPFHPACYEKEQRGEIPPPTTLFRCGRCHEWVMLKDAVEHRGMAFHPSCLKKRGKR